MKTLRFYARGDDLVTDPRAPIVVGQATKRVGRVYVPPSKGKPPSFPATEAAFELPESDVQAVNYMRRRVRDKSLWPADEHTAKACNAPFVRVEFKDGEWVAAASFDKSASDEPVKKSSFSSKAKD